MAAWVWWYGIKSPGYAVRTPPQSHTSDWLNRNRPLEPEERNDALRAYTTPTAPSWAPPGAAADPVWQEPLYSRAWWTTYNEATGSWAPWTRYHNPDVAGCDTGDPYTPSPTDRLAVLALLALAAGALYVAGELK